VCSSQELQAAYSDAAACLGGALLLVATADGAELSSEIAAGAPLSAPPAGPKPLPFLGNMHLYMKVCVCVCGVCGAERGRHFKPPLLLLPLLQLLCVAGQRGSATAE
jgi:hypothetical protein